eukprot:scaffold23617_cov90-Isochrysis_galbana.AAC.1
MSGPDAQTSPSPAAESPAAARETRGERRSTRAASPARRVPACVQIRRSVTSISRSSGCIWSDLERSRAISGDVERSGASSADLEPSGATSGDLDSSGLIGAAGGSTTILPAGQCDPSSALTPLPAPLPLPAFGSTLAPPRPHPRPHPKSIFDPPPPGAVPSRRSTSRRTSPASAPEAICGTSASGVANMSTAAFRRTRGIAEAMSRQEVHREQAGSAQCHPRYRTAREETMAPTEPHASARM